ARRGRPRRRRPGSGGPPRSSARERGGATALPRSCRGVLQVSNQPGGGRGHRFTAGCGRGGGRGAIRWQIGWPAAGPRDPSGRRRGGGCDRLAVTVSTLSPPPSERKNLLLPEQERWPLDPTRPVIQLVDVSIAFGDKQVLRGLNLEIVPGEKIGRAHV